MTRNNIHFSVDDTFGCFQWLFHNQESVGGIFDSTTFCYARYLYENYGIGTSFYCMYTDGKTSLGNMDSRWADQFQKYCDWMKFGFHCYDGGSDYSKASVNEIEEDYEKVYTSLKRITGGGNCFTKTLRLHYFAGNEKTVSFLKKKGIDKLLCADDDRKSYNLTEEATIELKEKGVYCDENSGMEYVRTDIRVENMKKVTDKVFENIVANKNIVIFTHERYLKDREIRNNLEKILEYVL